MGRPRHTDKDIEAAVKYAESQAAELPKSVYSFTLHLTGFDKLTDEIEQAIFNAGCDDALLGISDGQVFLDFDREAVSLAEAIRSAIEDVEHTPLGIRVVRVVPAGEQTINLFNLVLRLRSDKQGDTEVVEDLLRRFAK